MPRNTWDALSDDARRLVLFYLVDRVYVGPPGLPVEEQLRIV